DAAGAWTYTASSAHNEFAAGSTYSDTFSVASADGTLTSVTINIAGTNDAAVLSADVANLTETNSPTDISTSGTLTISDVDSPATFVAQAATVGLYGTFAIDAAGAWTYTASSAHNEFAAGSTYSDTFSVASADGTLSSVAIHILGTNDAAVLSADTRNLTETDLAAAISTSHTLTISDVDSPATFVAQAATVGLYGTFAIDAAGAWTYTASSAHNEFVAGTTYTDTFSVASADGTLTSVAIHILGTNDAAVLSADVANLTETNLAADISTSGTLTISDVDSPATFVAQAATASTYGTFAIDAAGAWTYTASSAHNEFAAGTTYTDTFSVAAADGTLTSVTINILGPHTATVPVARGRRPAALAHHPHPRHQRRRGPLGRHGQPDRDQPGRRYFDLRHADHQRRRQPGDLRRPGRHRRHLRHLRDRRRRRLDLHGELGAQRVCRRHHLHRHVLGGRGRRHADLGHHPHPRHQRRRGPLGRHGQPDRDQPGRRYFDLRHADHQRRRQPGALRRPGRHRRHLRHLRDRRRRRLDLHGELGAQRVCRRHHLHRHVLGGRGRRHADLGHHPHPRHQRRRGPLGRHGQPDRDHPGRRYFDLRHADHQRRRQPGDLRRPGRHRRHLRHLRDRRRRRLDLHGELGAQRVCRRHHLHRHVLGGRGRRHADLGHHPHPRHQRRRGPLGRHGQPDRDHPGRRYFDLRHADHQ